MPEAILKSFTSAVGVLSQKYSVTMTDLETEIQTAESDLYGMLKSLKGEAHDIEGLKQLAKILGGKDDE